VSTRQLGPNTIFLLLSHSCWFVNIGRPLWREGGSIIYNCCWSSPAHSWVRVPRGSWPYFTVSDSRHPQPGGPGPRIYIPKEQAGPVMALGTGFRFRRLLRLAGLRWRYSNRPWREDTLDRRAGVFYQTDVEEVRRPPRTRQMLHPAPRSPPWDTLILTREGSPAMLSVYIFVAFCLFMPVNCLFNDAVNSSVYISSIGWLMNLVKIWKEIVVT
jgi:hypothetical protein